MCSRVDIYFQYFITSKIKYKIEVTNPVILPCMALQKSVF